MQRTTPFARGDFGIGGARRIQGFVSQDAGVSLHDRLGLFDGAQVGFDQFDGRDLARAEHIADFAQ